MDPLCRNPSVIVTERSHENFSLEPAVSRVLFRRFRRWWSFLWAARCRTARATNSRSGIGAGHAGEANLAIGFAISDRSCSRWGLPCPPRHRGGGALLPHRFTLARRLAAPGGLFSVALSFESPRLAVSQHPALRSPDFPRRSPEDARRGHLSGSSEKREHYTAVSLGRVRGGRPAGQPPVGGGVEEAAAGSSFMISSQ